jgi:hypothetical protein
MFQLKVSNSDSFFLVTQIYATIKMGAFPGLSTKQLKELGKEVVVDVWEVVHSVDEAAVTVFDSDDVMADDNVDIVSAPSC